MNDAGYTLTETLAAMAVLGMAVGGLSLTVQVLGPQQLATSRTVARLEAARGAETLLERLLALGEPFDAQQPDQLSGDATGFHFQCGGTAPCRAELADGAHGHELRIFDGRAEDAVARLGAPATARFLYRDASATEPAWPPASPGRHVLRSIGLVRSAEAGDSALIEAKLWREQPATCAFDPVTQACR